MQRIIGGSPTELKDAYDRAPKRGTPAHELVRLYTALYMLHEGYTDISFERAVEEEVFWRPLIDRALVTILRGSDEWVLKVLVKGVWCQRAEAAKKRLLECKAEVLRRAIPVLNAILALASPYQLTVDEDGSLRVTIDPETWEWLGWSDYPCSENNVHFRLLEKTLKRELRIVAEMIEFERTGNISDKYLLDMYMARLEMLAKKIDAIREKINAKAGTLKRLENMDEEIK